MKFGMPTAQVFVPDGQPVEAALARTTYLAVSAHQDDVEIMASKPAIDCYARPDRWFAAVTVTDGRGSPRAGLYADWTDDDMQAIRITEQKKAAYVGDYGAMVFLDYPSRIVKNSAEPGPVNDLAAILRLAKPEAVFTHNPADKHDTHVATLLRVIAAIRALPAADRPKHLYGCEVWRDLDWMIDEDKVPMDLSDHENLQAALLGVYDSQIAGGKRYDLASMGRRKAHSTYFASHGVDESTGLNFAMDLSALIQDDSLDVLTVVQGYLDRFQQEVIKRVKGVS